jgi:Glycosyl hydrolase 108
MPSPGPWRKNAGRSHCWHFIAAPLQNVDQLQPQCTLISRLPRLAGIIKQLLREGKRSALRALSHIVPQTRRRHAGSRRARRRGLFQEGRMTAQNYPRCLANTLNEEGGWSNHPSDPGGPTMRGVIQAPARTAFLGNAPE